jgi:phage shock protein PspC (stress-responsive transcriptional regulator)
MHKVTSINLNGTAYQLDEDAYIALKAYLDHAELVLQQNPDKAEILADLEQAIGEKCGRYLGPQKTVVVKSEVAQIILEMGPVEAGESSGAGRSAEHEQRARDSRSDAPKRLYRIREGAMLAGVCTGLAAYLHVDVTVVRIAFALAAFFTSGVAILGYFVMMLVVPEANTSDEHAAAHGAPFNAQELVDRAKSFAKSSDAWRRHWRRRQREFRRECRREWRRGEPVAYWRAPDIPASIFAGVMTPIFGVITLAMFVLLLLVVHTLATTGQVSGWTIPPGMPFWVATLILFGVFLAIASPLSAARHLSHRAYGHYPTFALWSGLVWLTFVGAAVWFASEHQTAIRDFLENLPGMWRDVLIRLQER